MSGYTPSDEDDLEPIEQFSETLTPQSREIVEGILKRALAQRAASAANQAEIRRLRDREADLVEQQAHYNRQIELYGKHYTEETDQKNAHWDAKIAKLKKKRRELQTQKQPSE